MKYATNRRIVAAAALLVVSSPALAQDDNYQQFLFDACTAPTGLLAQRCGETLAGTGDVSSGSESSLNPSQFLAGNNAAQASAYSRGEDTRGAIGAGEAAPEVARIDLGPFGVSLNARWLDERFDASGARNYDLTKKSAQLGVDYRWSRGIVTGLWIAAEDARLEFDGDAGVQLTNAGRIETRGVGGAVFASFSSESGHSLDIGLGMTDEDHEFERRAVFEPVNPMVPNPVATLVETAAESGGEERWVSVAWSRGFAGPGWGVEPFAGLTWTETELDGYTEQDRSQSGLAMQTDGLDTRSLTATAGFSARRVISTEVAVLVPQVRAGYNWEFETNAATASSRFLLDTADNVLVVRDRAPDRDSLELGAGLVAVFPRGWSLFLDARATIGLPDRDRYVVTLGWRTEL